MRRIDSAIIHVGSTVQNTAMASDSACIEHGTPQRGQRTRQRELDDDEDRRREHRPCDEARRAETQHLTRLVDLPEEVVRGEEHQVAAEVTEPLHDVVLVRRDVLLVPFEENEVVGVRELVAVGDQIEVGVRDELARSCRTSTASAGTAGRTR